MTATTQPTPETETLVCVWCERTLPTSEMQTVPGTESLGCPIKLCPDCTTRYRRVAGEKE